jgi:isoleucyl-tRNA synthetase
VRQPLSCLHAVSSRLDLPGMLEGAAYEELILDELNIKRVEYGSDESAMADISFKANFKTLGPKFGPKMKQVASQIAAMKKAEFPLEIDGVQICDEDVVITRRPKAGMVVASEGEVVVAIETALDAALLAEGLAREFVSRVQNLRKEADFEVTQRIVVTLQGDDEVKNAVNAFSDYVKGETLCDEISFGENQGSEFELNGHQVKIQVEKV